MQVNSRYLCIFVNKNVNKCQHDMNNHCICVEYVCIRHCTYYVVGSVLLVWANFCMETRFFINHAFLMNFEFLSTTVNQGTIIRIENIFIVNKIDKFNVSGFRNTQAHSQRSSQCGERSNQSRVQILDFWTLISLVLHLGGSHFRTYVAKKLSN